MTTFPLNVNHNLLLLRNKMLRYIFEKNMIEDNYHKNIPNIIKNEIIFLKENINILKERYINYEISKLPEYNIVITKKQNDYLLDTDYFLIILSEKWPFKKPSYYIRSTKDDINLNYLVAFDIIFKKNPKNIKILYYIKNKLDHWHNDIELYEIVPYLRYLGNLLNRTLI